MEKELSSVQTIFKNNTERVKTLKEILDKYTFSVITGFWAMAFLIASFIVPPVGEIHPSVLTAVGEVFGFVAAVTGIKTFGDTKLKINKNKEDDKCN